MWCSLQVCIQTKIKVDSYPLTLISEKSRLPSLAVIEQFILYLLVLLAGHQRGRLLYINTGFSYTPLHHTYRHPRHLWWVGWWKIIFQTSPHLGSLSPQIWYYKPGINWVNNLTNKRLLWFIFQLKKEREESSQYQRYWLVMRDLCCLSRTHTSSSLTCNTIFDKENILHKPKVLVIWEPVSFLDRSRTDWFDKELQGFNYDFIPPHLNAAEENLSLMWLD